MSFPLAGVAVSALTQGIAFLYAQAGELLRRRRDRADAANRPGETAATGQERITIQVPPSLGGQVLVVSSNPAAVDAHASELLQLRSVLSNYVDGVQPLDPADPQLAQAVDELRGALEDIFGQHLTFAGEDRPATGQPVVRSWLKADTIRGSAKGVVVGQMTGGSATSEIDVRDVEAGADIEGVHIEKLGGP